MYFSRRFRSRKKSAESHTEYTVFILNFAHVMSAYGEKIYKTYRATRIGGSPGRNMRIMLVVSGIAAKEIKYAAKCGSVC